MYTTRFNIVHSTSIRYALTAPFLASLEYRKTYLHILGFAKCVFNSRLSGSQNADVASKINHVKSFQNMVNI